MNARKVGFLLGKGGENDFRLSGIGLSSGKESSHHSKSQLHYLLQHSNPLASPRFNAFLMDQPRRFLS
jgi:hypothetical protein